LERNELNGTALLDIISLVVNVCDYKIANSEWCCELANTVERHHPRDPLRPPARLGVCNPTQKSNQYYLRNGWSHRLQILPEHSQGLPIKILEKGSVGVARDCPIFGVPPVLRNR